MGATLSSYGLFGVKRKFPEGDEDADFNDETDANSVPPVRKKLKTAEYVYQHLFVDGENSDIIVKSLDREWKLHKLYLSQSPYFASMFSGKWRETGTDSVTIDFPDRRITSESLDIVFGALYKDAVDIDISKVISLAASAAALQLDGILQQCSEVMCDNISIKNVNAFLNASVDYALKDVEQNCREWLENNVLHYSNSPNFLRKISIKLMDTLISSPRLHVVQGELDVYYLLKKWMFVRIHQNISPVKNDLKTAADEYFSSWKNATSAFLASAKGQPFVPVFMRLRLHHILSSLKSYDIICEDNIIPKNVIEKIMGYQWRKQLVVEAAFETREEEPSWDDARFDSLAIRCGRVLPADGTFCWRWSGYFFGVDVLVTYKNRVLSVKRNCGSQPSPYSINMKADRKVCYKLSVVRFNDKRQRVWSQDSGVKWYSLKPDETVVACRIPSGIEFPLTVIFNFVSVPCAEDICGQVPAEAWNKYFKINAHSHSDISLLDDDSCCGD